MDFPADELAQRHINELVSGNGTLAGELRGNDPCREMRVVAGLDAHRGAGAEFSGPRVIIPQ